MAPQTQPPTKGEEQSAAVQPVTDLWKGKCAHCGEVSPNGTMNYAVKWAKAHNMRGGSHNATAIPVSEKS